MTAAFLLSLMLAAGAVSALQPLVNARLAQKVGGVLPSAAGQHIARHRQVEGLSHVKKELKHGVVAMQEAGFITPGQLTLFFFQKMIEGYPVHDRILHRYPGTVTRGNLW